MLFQRHIGIDYSGAGSPGECNANIRVSVSELGGPPAPANCRTRRNWSRCGLFEWLNETLHESPRTLVGIDHCFSLPQAYLAKQGIRDWDEFLRHFEARWNFRKHPVGNLVAWDEFDEYQGRSRLRLTEQFTSSAKSVFNHIGPGVAHSSFAGIPWISELRRTFRNVVHFWPFDGWTPADGKHCVVEVYPSIFSKRYDSVGHPGGGHAHDAYSVAHWMSEMDRLGFLPRYFEPCLTPEQKRQAKVEGWILGAM